MGKIQNKGKKISVFYSLIVLILLIVITGLYINNVVIFNGLMKKNKEMKEKLAQIRSENSKKKIEIESLTSFMRIKTIVGEKYDMSYNKDAIDKREIIISMKDTLIK